MTRRSCSTVRGTALLLSRVIPELRPLLAKTKGRDLLTLLHRHGRALTGPLSDTPALGVSYSAAHEVEVRPFREGPQPKLREVGIGFCFSATSSS